MRSPAGALEMLPRSLASPFTLRRSPPFSSGTVRQWQWSPSSFRWLSAWSTCVFSKSRFKVMSESKPVVPTIFGRNAVAYTTLSLISLFCLIPFVWLFLASFDGNASLFLRWPGSWTLNNYIGIFVREGGARWFFNSFVVVGTAKLIVLVLAGFAGRAMSRRDAWWKRPFIFGIVLAPVVPVRAIIVPLYKIRPPGNNV